MAPPINKPRLDGICIFGDVGAMVTPEVLCRALEGEGVGQAVEEHEEAKSTAKRGARSVYVGVGEMGKGQVCKWSDNCDVNTHEKHKYSPRGLEIWGNLNVVQKVVYLWLGEAEVVKEGVVVQAHFHVVQVAGPVRVRIPIFYGPLINGMKDRQI